MKKSIITGLLIVFGLSAAVFGQEKTVVNSVSAKNKLVGKHMFSLQWISWDDFGVAIVKELDEVYYLTGSQESRENTDSLQINGVITEINQNNFKFKGTIVTKVSHIGEGEECLRDGEMTFEITKNRKYWRLKEMDNPCDEAVDYIDIFFRK